MFTARWFVLIMLVFGTGSCLNIQSSDEQKTESRNNFSDSATSIIADTVQTERSNTKIRYEYYSDSTTIKSKKYLFEDEELGNQYFFNESEQLEDFSFVNLNSEVIFFCLYNENGPFATYGHSAYTVYNESTFMKGDTLKVVYYLAIPPRFDYKFYFNKIKYGRFTEIHDSSYTVNDELGFATSVFYKERINSDENFELEFILDLYSKDLKRIIHSDTSTLEVHIDH